MNTLEKHQSNSYNPLSALTHVRGPTHRILVQPRLLPIWSRSRAGLKPHQVMQPAPSDARPALILQRKANEGVHPVGLRQDKTNGGRHGTIS